MTNRNPSLFLRLLLAATLLSSTAERCQALQSVERHGTDAGEGGDEEMTNELLDVAGSGKSAAATAAAAATATGGHSDSLGAAGDPLSSDYHHLGYELRMDPITPAHMQLFRDTASLHARVFRDIPANLHAHRLQEVAISSSTAAAAAAAATAAAAAKSDPVPTYKVHDYASLAAAMLSIEASWSNSPGGSNSLVGRPYTTTIELAAGLYRMEAPLFFNTPPPPGVLGLVLVGSLGSAAAGADAVVATILDCGSATPTALAFTATNLTLSLQGLTLIRCETAVSVNVPLTDPPALHVDIQDCTFSDNNASLTSALFSNILLVTVSNSLFVNNTVYGIPGSLIPAYGAASFQSVTSLRMSNSSFLSNRGIGDASIGAVSFISSLALSSYLDVTNCLFANNSCTGENGLCAAAIIVTNVSTVSLTSTNFERNTCFGPGSSGALYVHLNNLVINGGFYRNNTMIRSQGLGVGAVAMQAVKNLTVQNTDFLGNIGDGQSGITLYSNGVVVLRNSRFHYNKGTAIVSANNAMSYTVINCSFVGNTISNNEISAKGWFPGTGLFLVHASLVLVQSCDFRENTHQFSYHGISSLALMSIANATIERCTFIGNEGRGDIARNVGVYFSGVVLVISSIFEDNAVGCDATNQRMEFYYFTNGAALSSSPSWHKSTIDPPFIGVCGGAVVCGGAAFHALDVTLVLIYNSTFKNNTAETMWSYGGAVQVLRSPLFLINCTFEDNTGAAGGAVAAIDTYLLIDPPFYPTLIGNTTYIFCGGSFMSYQLITIFPLMFQGEMPDSSRFLRNMAISGGAVMTTRSRLGVSSHPGNVCMDHGIRGSSGGLRFSVLFQDNVASTGGAISTLSGTGGFIIAGSILKNNSALASIGDLQKLNQNVYKNENRILVAYTEAVNVTLDMVIFRSLSIGCGAGNGGALCYEARDTFTGINNFIATSTMKGNWAVYGGAVYIRAPPTDCTKSNSCNILYMSGMQGCSPNWYYIYVPHPGNVRAPNSGVIIQDNVAVGGAGGGIYMESVDTLYLLCDENVYEEATAEQGYVESSCYVGRKVTPSKPTACKDWSGNRAIDGGFGDDFASSPINYTVSVVDPKQAASYTSTDPLPLQLRMFDLYGNEHDVAVPNNAHAALATVTVTVNNGSSLLSQLSLQPGGQAGVFPINQSTLRFQSHPGDVTILVVARIDYIRRDLPSRQLNVTVRKCGIGELLVDNGRLCLQCDVGRYSLDENAAICQVCPAGATCITSTKMGAMNPIILPDAQNFHSNPFSSQISPCPNPEACDYKGRSEALLLYQHTLKEMDPHNDSVRLLYNADEYYGLICAEGYTGAACALCEEGWGLTHVAKCVKCEKSAPVYGLYIFLVNLAAFIPLLWSMRVAMQNLVRWMPMGAMRVYMSRVRQQLLTEAACVKTIVSYLQIVGMYRWIHISSSASISLSRDVNVFAPAQHIADYVVYATSNLVSLSCSYTAGDGLDPTVLSVIVSFIIPIAGFLALVLIWEFGRFWASFHLKLSGGKLDTNNGGRHLEDPCGSRHFSIKPTAEAELAKEKVKPEKPQRLRSYVEMVLDPSALTKHPSVARLHPLARSSISSLDWSTPPTPTTFETAPSFSRSLNPLESDAKNLPTPRPSSIAQSTLGPQAICEGIEADKDTMLELGMTDKPLSLTTTPLPQSDTMDEDTMLELGMTDKPLSLPTTPLSQSGTMDEDTMLELGITDKHQSLINTHLPQSGTMDEDTMLELGTTVHTVPQFHGAVQKLRAPLSILPSLSGTSISTTYSSMSASPKKIPPVFLRNRSEEGGAGKGSVSVLREFYSAVVVAFLTSTFYYYPTLVQQSIVIFMCSSVDSDDDNKLAMEYGLNTGPRWIMNYGMDCFQGQHLYLVYCLGIPGIIFSFGVPVFWAWWLLHNKHHQEEASFKARYSFMYEDYKSEYYWWGSVEMLNKLLLLAILVLLSDHRIPPGLQLISALTVSTLYMLGLALLRPHFSKIIHRLNVLANICVVLTLQYCMYFSYPTIPQGYSAFGFLLGLLNILAVLTMAICWCHLVIVNMVMQAGMQHDTMHTFSSRTVVDVMWPKNNFQPWKRTVLQFCIAIPILFCYKVGHWVRCSAAYIHWKAAMLMDWLLQR